MAKRKLRLKITHTGIPYCESRIAIHLINPDQRELDQAIEDAERNMFYEIVCHYSNVIPIEAYDWMRNKNNKSMQSAEDCPF